MQSSDARILRGAAIPSALAGVAAAAAGALLGGPKGALGAAGGAILVIVFFSVSVIAVSYASRISPQMMFAAAVFSYIVKIFAMFAVIASLHDVSFWNTEAFGWTVIALTFVWLGAEMRATLRAKTLYVEPAAPAASEPAATAPAPSSEAAASAGDRSP